MSGEIPPQVARGLVDLARTLEQITRIVVAEGRDRLVGDERQQLAAQALGIRLGQDVASLPEDWRAEHTDVPWHYIRGLRNRFAHDYHEINYDIIWTTFAIDLPAVHQALRVDIEAARKVLGLPATPGKDEST